MKALFLLGGLVLLAGSLPAQTNTPTEWIDSSTGHRIVQLSREPGSESLYFNMNPFTPDGRRMVFSSPSGISTVDLQTHAIEKLVEGKRLHVIMVGHKTGRIFYGDTNRTVYAVDPRTKNIEKIASFPRGQMASTVNADETLLGGTILLRKDWGTNQDWYEGGTNRRTDVETAREQRSQKGRRIQDRFAKAYPMELFFYNIATGKTKTADKCNDWLNHLQFSPTDPKLLLFCHEGPWQSVDRVWTIRTDGSHLQLMHKRTMTMEIAGHEFWSANGDTVWYDLQTPRGEDFWVAGVNMSSGDRTWYHLQNNEWGVHFNVSPDGKLFSSDGGDEKMVGHAQDGKWIYLLHPELLEDRTGDKINTKGLIKPGVFHSEKLVNMSRHDYALEPNAMFSPDMKWIIFRSNMSGMNQVYAVELEKANPAAQSGDH